MKTIKMDKKTFYIVQQAAEIIQSADCLLIIAGAGMGVDSGLPDFRGDKGFWRIHPNFEQEGLSFQDLANPQWFFDYPNRAWGFYGHRYQLYNKTKPHEGFDILNRWCKQKQQGSFINTTNVDGHFQKSGFSKQIVYESHGSINYLQCSLNCEHKIWHLKALDFIVDGDSLLASGEVPTCPSCGVIARPNILMFGDAGWLPDRASQQRGNYLEWKQNSVGHKVAVIEIGVGISGCSARSKSWAMENRKLIRINPRDFIGDDNTLSIAMGAKDALKAIDDVLGRNG